MNSIVEIILTGLVDPLIWIKFMSSLGCNQNKVKCFGAFLGYYLLLVGRDLLAGCSNGSMIKMIMSFALAVYIFVVTYILFQGKLSEKIIGVCAFFCILFLSELITYELYETLIHKVFHTPVYARILYIVCDIFVKLFQIILCYWIFESKKIGIVLGKNKEAIGIVIVVASIISSIIMKNTSRKQSMNAAFIFQLIEILFIWYLVCSLVGFREKEKNIVFLSNEVSEMVGRQEHVRDVDRFRHDYASNTFVMKNLWNYKEYNELGKYVDKVFTDAVRVKILFEHPNFAIRIIISNLMDIAKKIGIPFSAEISVNEFQMKDEDICGILHNLVINALRDSVTAKRDEAHIVLQVSMIKNNYEIQCVNEFIDLDGFVGAFVIEPGEENLEFLFVEEIVKGYNGVIERNFITKDKKKSWKKVVLVQIPVPQKT
ncbi:MAG TPA: hypothetical protein DCW90_19890 [Lachnospiraceae bacterium]|nr:hypothetical protein [uncultured Lachnoclostridium sp.]HAU87660.1 hypothetical protein [Lachnospiraceae bacterium]